MTKISTVTQEDIKAFAEEMRQVDWADPEARRAVALTILRYVQEDIQREDLESLLVETTTFNIGETPQWVTRKGLKAYVHEPGSYAPRSTITQKVLTVTTEQVSVHPEFELNQLRAGRYGSIADIRRESSLELLGRKNSIIWSTVVGSVTSADTNYASVATNASAATKLTALDAAIDYVEDNCPGGVLSIAGRHNTLGFMATNSIWSELTKTELERTGQISSYRGYPIVKLKQYTDGYGNRWISENEIMVLGRGASRLGRNQGLEVMDDINIDDKMWHLRVDEQYGVITHYPQWLYRIRLT